MNRPFCPSIFAAALSLGLMAAASAALAQSADTHGRDLSLEAAGVPDPASTPEPAPTPAVAPAPVVAAAPVPEFTPPPAVAAAPPPRPHAARVVARRPFRAYQALVPVRIHRRIDVACFGR